MKNSNIQDELASNPKRPKNFSQKVARYFSGQDSTCQPKVFIKTGTNLHRMLNSQKFFRQNTPRQFSTSIRFGSRRCEL